jgi:DeoR/GlpR family transcriptional regulator of sugar metabolism
MMKQVKKTLKKNERQERILAELRARPTVRVSTLADEFGVTTETIRRDMDELTGRGLVDRMYGGAATRTMATEPVLSERDTLRVAERVQIARTAMALINSGDVLMIDNGSTTAHFARRLAADGVRLTVITNSFAVASVCARNKTIRVLMCPGEYNNEEVGVYGPETMAFLRRFNAGKAIIGAGGLTIQGITDADPNAGWVKRTMLERAEQGILLLDSDKFEVKNFDIVCPLTEINDLVTDADPGKKLREAIKKAGMKLHIGV